MKAFGGYGFGYGYLDKVNPKNRGNHASGALIGQNFADSDAHLLYSQQLASNSNSNEALGIHQVHPQQHNSVPRKNPSGRYSYLNIENYAPPPSQFVQEFSTTRTTSFTKSTENILGTYNISDSSINSACECNNATDMQPTSNSILKQKPQSKDCIGYYSRLPKTNLINNNRKASVSAAQPTPTTNSNAPTTSNNDGRDETVATVSEITRL